MTWLPATMTEACVYPLPLAQEERRLLAGPVLDEMELLGRVAVAVDEALLGLVDLHPDRGVKQWLQLATDDSGSLHPHDIQAGGNGDRPGAVPLLPGVRPVVDVLAPAQGLERVLGQKVGPIEERVVPGEVVGVHDCRVRYLH